MTTSLISFGERAARALTFYAEISAWNRVDDYPAFIAEANAEPTEIFYEVLEVARDNDIHFDETTEYTPLRLIVDGWLDAIRNRLAKAELYEETVLRSYGTGS